jgi:hypothetical protein
MLFLLMIAQSADFTYTLEPTWFLARGNSPTRWAPIPAIVTDVDGDGRREVVLVTNDFHLKVLSAERTTPGDGIYTPTELFSRVLTYSVAEKDRLPVALKVGYIEPYSDSRARTQVIVVVLEDWTVICFDHRLQTLWEKEVGHFSMEIERMHDLFRINEVAVYISPIDIVSDELPVDAEGTTESNFGLVVIGASMGYRVDANSSTQNAHDFESVRTELGLQMEEDGDVEHGDLTRKIQLEHFSLFALGARSGKVIWKHDGTEMQAEQFTKSLPQHSLLSVDRLTFEARKDLTLQAHHTTRNNDWNVYKNSLLGEMPHDWHRREDTALGLSYFSRKHVGSGSDVQASRPGGGKRPISIKSGEKSVRALTPSEGGGSGRARAGAGAAGGKGKGKKRPAFKHGRGLNSWLTGLAMPAVPHHQHQHGAEDGHGHGHVLPHDAIEHVEHPNVVVAHTKKGLDVVSLARGTPITALALTEGSTYSDLNGDGVVDTILLLENEQAVTARGAAFAHGGGELLPCTMMVISGLPAKAQLFNASVCLSHSSINEPASLAHRSEKRQAARVASVKAAPPLVLRRMSDRRPTVEDRVKDIVVAINTGVVTSYSGDGKFKWQARGAPAWKMDFAFASVSSYDFDFYRAEEHYEGHQNHPFSQVLVQGQFALSVLDRHGEALASTEIPKFPILAPVLSDFDNDGVTDVIVTTENAVLGYRMHIQVSTPLMFIALCMLSAVAFLAFVMNIKSVVVLPPVQTLRSNANGRRMYSLRRSTDDDHHD